jgi:hypothetical protein
MKFEDTIAYTCRYGEIANEVWGDWDILWEDSEADYQGHAKIFATKDGKYSYYEWWYGSCSGCDTWEAADLGDEAIEAEMKDTALWFKDRAQLKIWINSLLKSKGETSANARAILRAIG